MKVDHKQQEWDKDLYKNDGAKETQKKQQTQDSSQTASTHSASQPEATKDWQKFSKTEEASSAPGVKKHNDKRHAEEAQGQITAAELLRQHQQKSNGIPS